MGLFSLNFGNNYAYFFDTTPIATTNQRRTNAFIAKRKTNAFV